MKHQRGQTLILVAIALVALIGLTALAIDGGHAFSVRRQAQSAADAAALAAAYASVQKESTNTAAMQSAAANGFTPNGERTQISLASTPVDAEKCGKGVDGMDYTVTIHAVVDTWFGGVVGIPVTQNTVRATARRCDFHYQPFFWGNAVVGLNPNPAVSFDANGTAGWSILGGGIYANGSVQFSNNSGSTSNVPDGISAVGSVSNAPAGTPISAAPAVKYPSDILAKMPPNPCVSGGVGVTDPYAGYNKTTLPDPVNFNNGVYCIDDFDKFDSHNIVLNNATLYVTDKDFHLNFSGGGGFSGSPTSSGTYAGYYLIVHLYTDVTCTKKNETPELVWAGNGLGNLQGTILAPSACVDVRGNSNNYTMNSQIIGHTVLSTGSSSFAVNYNASQNAKEAVPPTIQLLK